MKRITEFTVPSANNGVTYIVECKYGEDLCTVYASNCPEYTWKENHDIVDNMFAKEDWITSEDKLELPSKFYITTSPDETAYKYLVTETEGGNYNITSSNIVAWWRWERVEANILADIWTYFPIESASSFEADWIIVDEMNELENIIAKWQNDNPEKPLADDFYFKWHLTDTLYRAQLHREGYTVSWENTAPCGVGRAGTFFTKKQVKDNLKNNVWLIVESNGTDATGTPLNFTKDMLKPSMRFRTGNNGQYIAVQSEVVDDNGNTVVSIIGASGRGWIEFELVNTYGDDIGEEYRAMSVYEKPEGNGDIINPDKHGKLIWQANK
jgi:hypothetical protein